VLGRLCGFVSAQTVSVNGGMTSVV
jgi:hypothetical protein